MEVASNNNSDNDMLTELLIAKLLEDDMRAIEHTHLAEEFQMNETLTKSALDAGHFPEKAKSGVLGRTNYDVVLDILAAEIAGNRDALVAHALQSTEDSNLVASRQYAQKLAAAEKKSVLDSAFAKRLQEAIDNGEDDEIMKDVESALGLDAIEHIMAGDMNDKGKGKVVVPASKGKEPPPASALQPSIKDEDALVSLHPTCGICLESFQATHSPATAARSANSSTRLQFGTILPCPLSHGYCISCLNSYIHSKLDPDGNGAGNQNSVVFPIRCPECAINEWPAGIPDAVAERVLSEKWMLQWHHQKLLDSVPRYYCPNPRCSALVQMDEDEEDPQALCPSCNTLICVPCRVVWHADFTCEEYQSLPLDERSPEDQKALQLMKARNWRRCPSCAVIVELTVGCNHITCRCKTEFCFKCGALWNAQEKSCSRVPACDLWDEQMLLEEREGQREHEQQMGMPVVYREVPRLPPAPVPPPPYQPPLFVGAGAWAHQPQAYRDEDELDWIDDSDVICMRHWFTANMINALTCQYCDAKLGSVADLRYHLSHVRRHAVYACCGRFFKRDVDFDRHMESKSEYSHEHTVRRNAES